MGEDVKSAEVEGYTPSGIPYGSASGRIYRKIPWFMRKSYTIPSSVSEISDYDERYRLIARLALESDVSAVSTPNPSTLIRLATLLETSGHEFIKQIQDGTCHIRDTRIHSNFRLAPNKKRAAELERLLHSAGRLLPKDVWPKLSFIGCWLGGTVGILAPLVKSYYGELPFRDLGYLASEGRFTLPISDETPAGIPDILSNFFEFIPVDEIENPKPAVLLIHELSVGESYYIMVTNWAGLYRYDINDIIQVTDVLNGTPLFRFLRKGRDMASITGEKLHANHCIEAVQRLAIRPFPFRFEPDLEMSFYRLYCEHAFSEAEAKQFAEDLDKTLRLVNLEYESKRNSGRLGALRIHVMQQGWAEAEKRTALAAGQREVQFKWKIIGKVTHTEFEQFRI